MKKGIILILSAELLFTIASALTKKITMLSDIGGADVTFFRFAIGLFCMSGFIAHKRLSLKAQKPLFISLRGIFNTLAVMFFFGALGYTTVGNANMLNMTYPIFVFLLSPFINNESSRKIYYLFLISAMAGIYLIAFPDLSSINRGDILALTSAVMAGFGITSLRQAGKYDSPYLILFYLMLFGTVINGLWILPDFKGSSSVLVWVLLILSGIIGFGGQILLTVAYKFIDARSGALTSSSRNIFAITIGAAFFSEAITTRIIIGCLLILISLAALSRFFERFFSKGVSR
jgi:drug/metabolite transporter (DMT)-like permease